MVAPRSGGGDIFELLRVLLRNRFVVTLLARDERCFRSLEFEPVALALLDRMWLIAGTSGFEDPALSGFEGRVPV